MARTVTEQEASEHLSDLLEEAAQHGDAVVIERPGKSNAVLIIVDNIKGDAIRVVTELAEQSGVIAIGGAENERTLQRSIAQADRGQMAFLGIDDVAQLRRQLEAGATTVVEESLKALRALAEGSVKRDPPDDDPVAGEQGRRRASG